MNKNIHRGIVHLALLAIIGVVVLGGIYGASTNDYIEQSLSSIAAVSGYSTTTPVLRVTSPNGGETWTKGSTRTITWSGGASTWKLEVLLKNASTTNTVVTIATSTANTGSLSWKVPTTINSRTYNVRIKCTNCTTGGTGTTDLSDKPFNIKAAVIAPDLIAEAVDPVATVVGTPTAFKSFIRNQGSASTGAGFIVTFQRASDVVGTGASTIGSTTTRPLASAASRIMQMSSGYTFSTAGTYYVRACADAPAPGVITESNASGSGETNNCGPYTPVSVSATPIVRGEATGGGSSLIQVAGSANDGATFRLDYTLTAVGGDIYVSPLVDVTSGQVTPGKTSVRMVRRDTYPNPDVVVLSGTSARFLFPDSTAVRTARGNYKIARGQSTYFRVEGTVQLPAAGPVGDYKMQMNGVSWSTADVAAPEKVLSAAAGNLMSDPGYMWLD